MRDKAPGPRYLTCLKHVHQIIKIDSLLRSIVTIEFSRNCTKLTMLSILYYFAVKGKLFLAKCDI